MLVYAAVLFIVALVAAVLGFRDVAVGAAGIAQVLFVLFGLLAIGASIARLASGRDEERQEKDHG